MAWLAVLIQIGIAIQLAIGARQGKLVFAQQRTAARSRCPLR